MVKPTTVKHDKNFSVKIRIPETDCACGAKYDDLLVVSRFRSDGAEYCVIKCPRCRREAGDRLCSTQGLALLAWHRKISKEVKK